MFFHLQYIQYLETHSVEEARAVYRRACLVHLTHKHTLHMHWATFEERHGEGGATRPPDRNTEVSLGFHVKGKRPSTSLVL